MARDIYLEWTYPHPPERVWQALTEPAPSFDGVQASEVIAFDAPRVVSYTWRGGGINSIVTYTLEPTADGTRVHVSQTGFEGMRGLAVRALLGRRWRLFSRTTLPAMLDRLTVRGR